MSSARRSKGQQSRPWWAYRRNRNKVWLGLAAGGVVGVIAFFVWMRASGGGVMSEGEVPIGQNVEAVQLEDSRTGSMFDLGKVLGTKDVVIVAYMGDFCLGCSELVAELERRVPDFEAADAFVVGLGDEVGTLGRETVQKRGIESYPLLQEGSPHSFTRSIGMWSDHMRMPFMGYVIINKDGVIVAGEQTSLSEAKGAAPRNVDQLLEALVEARQLSASLAPSDAPPVVSTAGQ